MGAGLGIIGTAVAGAMSSGIQTAEQMGKLNLQEEAAKIQAQRDATLNEYTKQNLVEAAQVGLEYKPKEAVATQTALAPGVEAAATAASQRKIAEEAAKPMSPGSTVRGQNGQPDFTAPVLLTPEQRDYWEERAKYYKMLGEAGPKGEKEPLPKVIPMKDDQGNIIGMLDENSGAIGTPVPPTPGKPAVSHWIGKDEPAVPGKSADLAWTHNGKPLPNGLADLYPKIGARTGSAGARSGDRPTPPPASAFDKGAKSATPGSAGGDRERIFQRELSDNQKELADATARGDQEGMRLAQSNIDALNGEMKRIGVTGLIATNSGQPASSVAAPAAAAAPPKPVQTQASPQDTPAALAFDAANAQFSRARDAMMKFGTIQRNRDPEGYKNAQAAVEAASRELARAKQAYEGEVQNPGPASRTLSR